MKNRFDDQGAIQIGDTLSVPQSVHRMEKHSNAIGEVIGIYSHTATLKQKNGVKFSIYRNDLDNYQKKGIEIVSRAASSMVEEQTEDIINNM